MILKRIWTYREICISAPLNKSKQILIYKLFVSDQTSLILLLLLKAFKNDKIFLDLFFPRIYLSLHKKWSFPLRISTINVTKLADSYGFAHIYWKNP